ncbi:excisionase family DNA-binding protein [Puniceibacterium antarcticum]|uniref:excisionase family DNA-binding protein n=1 Tax=Puniceibacterium antarcticum TaxID=1206336 RepID=UPI003CCBD486
MSSPIPFTPETLGERWQCSAETVRQLLKRGQLNGFRVGRMFRIPADAVEEYECQRSVLGASEAGSASTGMVPMERGAVISLRHAPERRQKPKVGTDICAKQERQKG